MKALIAASLVSIALSTALASANPEHHARPPSEATRGGGMMGMMHCPMMGGHVEGALAFLKTELKISDAQASAWNDFADAYRDFMTSRPAAMMRQRGGMMEGAEGSSAEGAQHGSMSYPDRMKAHMQMMQKHVDAGQKLEPAVEDLYAALNREQRKTADELLPMFTMGGMM